MKYIQKIKRFIKKIKWNFRNWFRLNEHWITPKLYKVTTIIKILLFVAAYLFFMKILDVIDFDFCSWHFIKILDIKYQDIYKDLVIAQIGSTFLTTAILSMVASIEGKRIFGEKATDLLFGGKLMKFYAPMFVLYLAMIINIILVIKEKHANVITLLFFSAISILIFLITKIGSVFVTTQKYHKYLYAKYYRECERIIINNVLPRNYDSKLLNNLKEETLRLICDNDTSYIKNLNMYEVLIDRLLFNIPKKFQQYHLDMPYAPSIFNDYVEILDNLIFYKNYLRVLQCYTWILNRLNFHNLFIPYDSMNKIFDDLVNKILDLNNEYEMKNYLQRLSIIITGIEMQQHFALANDYTYIEKHRLKYLHFYCYNGKYFETIYKNIYDNKYLNLSEKNNCYTELFEIFRMSAHRGCNVINDITNFTFEFKEPQKRVMSPCIVGQAMSLLLLRILLNRDDRSFKLFIGMNVTEEEKSFAIHTMILALVKMQFSNMEKNIYNEFYGINFKYCRQVINEKAEIIFTPELISSKKLQESYNNISTICIKKDLYRGALLEYIFRFEKDLIDEYFLLLDKKFMTKINIVGDCNEGYATIINQYI